MKNTTETPTYWHSSIESVNEDLAAVSRGRVTELLPSAGKRKIHLVEYGKSNLPPSMASLSSALG